MVNCFMVNIRKKCIQTNTITPRLYSDHTLSSFIRVAFELHVTHKQIFFRKLFMLQAFWEAKYHQVYLDNIILVRRMITLIEN